MQYAILPVLSLLLVWFLAGAALPFTILAERRRAVTRRRAFYDKSADQIGALQPVEFSVHGDKVDRAL